MEQIAYVNGSYVPLSEAKVSILDRGFLFADGIYEVAAVLDGKLIDNASHLARLERSVGEIELALARGAVVLSDRYDLSSLAYQSVAARLERGGSPDARDDARLDWLRSLNQHARRPDLTLVVDVDPAVAEARRRARGGAEELYETTRLQAELARAYASAESLVVGDRVVHVDGNAELEQVAERVREALAPWVEG